MICIAFQAKLGVMGFSHPRLRPGLLSLRSWRLPDAQVAEGDTSSLTTVTDCRLRSGQLSGKERLMVEGGGLRIFPSPKVTHRPRTAVTDCSLRSGQLSGHERLMIDD